MLSQIARSIWEKLGDNERANAATTIAVIKCHDKKLYCTSNDVSQISKDAVKEAEKHDINPIGGDVISQSGAGFHAEMWAVIQAIFQASDKGNPLAAVTETIAKIGASRACCKNCSDVLEHLNVATEQPSTDSYSSWYNPMTVGEDCMPRKGFEKYQLNHIPDFRNHGNDYWFTPNGNGAIQQSPPN